MSLRRGDPTACFDPLCELRISTVPPMSTSPMQNAVEVVDTTIRHPHSEGNTVEGENQGVPPAPGRAPKKAGFARSESSLTVTNHRELTPTGGSTTLSVPLATTEGERDDQSEAPMPHIRAPSWQDRQVRLGRSRSGFARAPGTTDSGRPATQQRRRQPSPRGSAGWSSSQSE
jgi:hypothetical protein